MNPATLSVQQTNLGLKMSRIGELVPFSQNAGTCGIPECKHAFAELRWNVPCGVLRKLNNTKTRPLFRGWSHLAVDASLLSQAQI